DEARRHRVGPSLEEQHRVLDVARVLLLRDQPDARRAAAMNLILQARPRAVGEIRVVALAEPKELLQLVQRGPDRAGARIGPVELAAFRARAAVEREPRIVLARID